MKLKLTIIAGPQKGQEFVFDGHDTFLVGRANDAHCQLTHDDPFFSRRHFLVEVNPPRCRVIDLNTRNGTRLNGVRIQTAEVADGDEITAGNTVFKVNVLAEPDDHETVPTTLRTAWGFPIASRPLPSDIPGYRFYRELGRGGMGVVYRATRERDDLPVAIKTILPAAGTSRRQIDRFLRECQILAQLQHPNIVAFRECGESASLIFLVMDLIEGPDVGAWLDQTGPLDVRTAARIVCHMLAGLAHAHGRGFVHRDIKPSNILIGGEGHRRTAMLADFGLARVYEASRISGLTMQGEIGGTPAFMAPEQVTHYREVQPAADQYSAAATLYNMLTGHTVHDLPKNVGAQIAHIVTEEPIPITQRKPDLPTELAAIIHKALSREPQDRYPNVLAFRQELTRYA